MVLGADCEAVSDLPEPLITRSADGTTLAYHVSGSGPSTLVWMENAMPFEPLLDDPGFRRFFARLATFCRVFHVEARGVGASEGDPRHVFIPGAVSDADLMAVMAAAGAERAVLIGFSTGGQYAIHFAATHPERVDALVLIDTFAHYIREDDYPWGHPREGRDAFTAGLERAWVTGAELETAAPSRATDERLRALWGRGRRSRSPSVIAEVIWQSREWDGRGLLPSISCRTLVLHREGDRSVHLGAGRYLAEHIAGAKFVVLPGEDHLYFVGDTDALVDEIEEFLTGSRTGAEASVVGLTILFTDIVGSTEQEARLGLRAWSRLTDSHEVMVRDVLARHRGRGIRTTGDGVLATFDASGRALRCAIEIVARAKSMGLDLRAGIHTGDVELRGNDIGGLQVNIARRVCDLAVPGEVWVSETVKSATTGSGFAFKEQGQYELKGVPGVWRLFEFWDKGQQQETSPP